MRRLEVLRDDGPLARRVAAFLAPPARPGPLAWLGPPLVRAVEYGGLIGLTATTDRAALPACFAFLAAIAFHHYDVLYRLQSGRELPPRWVAAIGGGWEVRLLLAVGLASLSLLEPAFIAAAAVLGTSYVAESAAGWIRSSRDGRPEAAETTDPEAME